jgi:hypothetical protein
VEKEMRGIGHVVVNPWGYYGPIHAENASDGGPIRVWWLY